MSSVDPAASSSQDFDDDVILVEVPSKKKAKISHTSTKKQTARLYTLIQTLLQTIWFPNISSEFWDNLILCCIKEAHQQGKFELKRIFISIQKIGSYWKELENQCAQWDAFELLNTLSTYVEKQSGFQTFFTISAIDEANQILTKVLNTILQREGEQGSNLNTEKINPEVEEQSSSEGNIDFSKLFNCKVIENLEGVFKNELTFRDADGKYQSLVIDSAVGEYYVHINFYNSSDLKNENPRDYWKHSCVRLKLNVREDDPILKELLSFLEHASEKIKGNPLVRRN